MKSVKIYLIAIGIMIVVSMYEKNLFAFFGWIAAGCGWASVYGYELLNSKKDSNE